MNDKSLALRMATPISTHLHHEQLLKGIQDQFRNIFDDSSQGVYIYLDDIHKICNSRFASLLKYKSAAEWSGIKDNFLETFVDRRSQKTLSTAFNKTITAKAGGSVSVSWKTKGNHIINTNVIIVPVTYNNHTMALHFISKKNPIMKNRTIGQKSITSKKASKTIRHKGGGKNAKP